MNKFVKITKNQEWELLSKNKFQTLYARANTEEKDRENLFSTITEGFNFDECNCDESEKRILVKNRSRDYVDNKDCYYEKKGQVYMLETQKTIVVLKDYGFSLSFRVIRK